jgi:hypothetical protein
MVHRWFGLTSFLTPIRKGISYKGVLLAIKKKRVCSLYGMRLFGFFGERGMKGFLVQKFWSLSKFLKQLSLFLGSGF